jgi:hypothetical protein
MRRILISLLLAGAAATPAIAGPHNWSNNQQAQEDRQQAREERQQARQERQQSREDARSERSDNRPSYNAHQYEGQQQQQHQQFVRPDFNGQGGPQPQQFERRGGNNGQVVPNPYYQQREQRVQDLQQRFEDRRDARQDARELRQSNRPEPNVVRNRHPLVVSNTPAPGTQPPLRAEGYRHGGNTHWNTNWRHDNRYDWNNYRHRHRSLFHLGFYFDPYGWGYQPFQIGWRLWPSYYSNRYWINDPWMYRLPYAPPGYVWVRYWNDALLVDTWSGEVVDMIPGFFW